MSSCRSNLDCGSSCFDLLPNRPPNRLCTGLHLTRYDIAVNFGTLVFFSELLANFCGRVETVVVPKHGWTRGNTSFWLCWQWQQMTAMGPVPSMCHTFVEVERFIRFLGYFIQGDRAAGCGLRVADRVMEDEENAMAVVGALDAHVPLVQDACEETMLLWGLEQPTLAAPNSLVCQASLLLKLDACGQSLRIEQAPASMV